MRAKIVWCVVNSYYLYRMKHKGSKYRHKNFGTFWYPLYPFFCPLHFVNSRFEGVFLSKNLLKKGYKGYQKVPAFIWR